MFLKQWWCHKYVKVSKVLSNFELVMNFGSFGQTTVDHQSLWIVLCATFRFVQMHGILWSKCNVPSRHHVLCMMLKGILIDICMLHKWNPKFEGLHVYFLKFQTKFAGHGTCKHHFTCNCALSLCQIQFEIIWTMLGELMVQNL